jgi:carbonic anhydrase
LRTVSDIREKSPIISELEAEGKLKVVGAMYDVATGEVTWL